MGGWRVLSLVRLVERETTGKIPQGGHSILMEEKPLVRGWHEAPNGKRKIYWIWPRGVSWEEI